jgi:polyferredoxin
MPLLDQLLSPGAPPWGRALGLLGLDVIVATFSTAPLAGASVARGWVLSVFAGGGVVWAWLLAAARRRRK